MKTFYELGWQGDPYCYQSEHCTDDIEGFYKLLDEFKRLKTDKKEQKTAFYRWRIDDDRRVMRPVLSIRFRVRWSGRELPDIAACDPDHRESVLQQSVREETRPVLK